MLLLRKYPRAQEMRPRAHFRLMNTLFDLKKNKTGYTAISRVRLGRGSNAQKSTKKLFLDAS